VLLLHKDAPQTVIVAQAIPDDYATRYRFGVVSPDQQPTADPRVRVALRRSIDFKTIGEFLSNRTEFEAAGIPVDLSPMTHVPQNPTYWLNPEKGELGKVSENYLFNVAEAKKLTAAAGFNGAVPLFFPVRLTQGQFTDADQLVIDNVSKAGTFNLDILRVASAPEYRKYQVDREMDGIHGTEQGSTNDVDYFIMRDYHSKGRADGRQAYAHAKIDELAAAQRRELDVEKRAAVLKEFQIFMAEWMPAIPGQHMFTTFQFRWPWLHNANYGEVTSPPGGRPSWGGHLHWLDESMPNRETGAA
jgi:ABC-type transport system substrate-binding protein